MKLEPVYLLEPEPDTRVKLSRRAFVSTMCSVGVLGVASGWTARGAAIAARSPEENPHSADQDEPTMDKRHRRIEWARAIAAGDIEELLSNARGFLVVLSEAGQDVDLWIGMERLTERVLGDENSPASAEPQQSGQSLPHTVLEYLDRLTPPESRRDRIEQLRRDLSVSLR